jgi:ABC-type transport system substrate-binding protein
MSGSRTGLAGTDRQLSRRDLLFASALGAAAAVVAGCTSEDAAPGRQAPKAAVGKGSHTRALPLPGRFTEAPDLAAKVKSGDLPALADRLPEHPYVVPHRWLKRGKYGGTLRLVTDDTEHPAMKEYMYGHSPLRWLNDANDVGPGLAESWETNADNSVWTLHFRKGLRWSDGKPCTTADVMFWWTDMVLDEQHPEAAPAEFVSADGTVAKVSAPDELTLVIEFNTPAPLTAFYLANWVKAGNGPTFIAPKHYLRKFHPSYTKGVGADWADTFEHNRNYGINPDCPTMTGWRLRSYNEGRSMIWERNPYYWCVSPDGDQLPYIDTLSVAAVKDTEVAKLQIQEGDMDYVHGTFSGVSLADISGLQNAKSRSGLDLMLWDSGSGCGSLFFFNFNYREPAIRALINEPKFRQALSHAVDRKEIQKAVFYNTGYPTTGTYNFKASDYLAGDEGRSLFEHWRDSYVAYDPKKAGKMLDDLGVVDRDGDGVRELPDGEPLRLRLDQSADAAPDGDRMADHLMADWRAIGLDVVRNPVPPAEWQVKWQAGELMTYTAWLNPSMPVHECMVSPELMVPIGNALAAAFWAPLYANFHMIRGTDQVAAERDVDPYQRNPPNMEPPDGDPVHRLWELYDQAKVETDAMKRYGLVWEIIKIHIEHGPFYMGVVGNFPVVELAHTDLVNVPRRENLALNGLICPWQHPTPAAYDTEAYFWRNPDAHT